MVTATELRELQAAERDLEPVRGGGGVDFGARLDYLRLVRKLQLRRSALVAQAGLPLLNDPASRRRLGEEVWEVLEQVSVATMDINQLDAAKECIGALMLKFPKSVRVGRLEGMWLEAKGWWDQADKVYASLLKDHPQDQKLMKRQVAVFKGRGQLLAASEQLRKYLEVYQADMEAWRELADLYLAQSMLKQASFCQEELLLSSPANPIYNLQYAETLYTLGGPDNLKAARSYYAAAIEFSGGDNVRALWGVCMVEAALKGSATKSSKAGKGDSELAQVAADTLLQMYQSKCPEKKAMITAVINRLVPR